MLTAKQAIVGCRGSWMVLPGLIHALCALGEPAAALNPVTFRPAPTGTRVELVSAKQAKAAIVMPEKSLSLAAQELQSHIELATGAKLPIVETDTDGARIVLCDAALAAKYGLDVAKMPPEGFEIKTFSAGVAIAGQNVLWGVYEFLERFVGVRWYFPGDLGRSVPKTDNLAVEPVWIADAPVFRKRENWPGNYAGGPELHRRLRNGQSWPNRIACHTPIGWPKPYGEAHPEFFQLRADGSREMSMLCYSHPGTLKQYRTTIEEYYAGKYVDDKGNKVPGPWGWFPPDDHVISVSPNDAAVTCRCKACRAKWDDQAGHLGEASLILADFVRRLARKARTRWPDKTVTYLAYANYTIPPKKMRFPGNVEVHVCGMRGLANYKEPEIARSEQEIIDGWYRVSGRALQNWHYICWPDDSTTAPYLFPHVVQTFYRANRDKTVGTFINGGGNHWPRHQVSLYAWLKCLWNPDFNVDAAIDEYCQRMFGPASQTIRELVQVQIDGWEKSRWRALPAGHNVSPKSVHEETYPPETVKRMKALLEKARQEAAPDELAKQRVEYHAGPFEAFFKESEEYHGGTGRTVVSAMKVGEDPAIDGQLTDEVYARATPVSFRRALDRQSPEAKYPTEMRVVWTVNGVTFALKMADPEPDKLVMKRKGRDDGMLWWDDNIELFLDPAGQRANYYQWIVTPAATVYDGSFTKGAEWSPEGVKVASHIGQDFWSCEVFIPHEVFRKEGVTIEATGLAGKTWYGNFTRHRVSVPNEMQRLNTTFEGSNHNMVAFGPIRFVE